MLNHLLVVLGGGIGALFRYRIGIVMSTVFPGYVGAGTLFVNVLGSFAIGYSLGVSQESKVFTESARLFFVVGVLGGLTTFSSLIYETAILTHAKESGHLTGFGHLIANVIFGLAAVWFGGYFASNVSAS